MERIALEHVKGDKPLSVTGTKPKALEKTELSHCFQIHFPLLKFYFHLFKILYKMGEARNKCHFFLEN